MTTALAQDEFEYIDVDLHVAFILPISGVIKDKVKLQELISSGWEIAKYDILKGRHNSYHIQQMRRRRQN